MYKLLPIPIALVLGVVAMYFNISYIGLGILIGLGLSLFSYSQGTNRNKVMMALVTIALSFIGFAYSWYLSTQYGLSFVELSEKRELPPYVHSAPFFSVAFFTAGLIDLLHYWLIGKDKQESNQKK